MHEPRVALDGGADGLDVQRRVAAAAPTWLAPGGHLLVETSEHQAPHTVDVVAAAGLIPRVARSDELDATVVIGTKAPCTTYTERCSARSQTASVSWARKLGSAQQALVPGQGRLEVADADAGEEGQGHRA